MSLSGTLKSHMKTKPAHVQCVVTHGRRLFRAVWDNTIHHEVSYGEGEKFHLPHIAARLDIWYKNKGAQHVPTI